MTLLLEKLPTILVLAVLVAIFVSLRKHTESVRVRLWIFAWALIFVHFLIQVFETRTGVVEEIFESIDLVALELSGVVFLVSLMRGVENRAQRLTLLLLLMVPTTFHAIAASFDCPIHWLMAAAIALSFLGGGAFPFFVNRKWTIFTYCLGALVAGVGGWAIYHQLQGSAGEGVTAALTLSFGLSGVLYWRRFPRFSWGVLTVAGGFLAWGAVFPVGALMNHFYPKLQVNPELWNVPKFFVAFGMILTLLEEKSRIIEQASEREHAENALLERFSRITSRLLSGSIPASLCTEITEVITETANFLRAAIFLSTDDGSLFLAGESGFSPAGGRMLRERASRWNAGTIKRLCATGTRLENNSFRIRLRAPGESDPGSPMSEFGGEVLVPMISSRGAVLGCLSLFSPMNPTRLDASAIAKLEMLAADLAVTIENARLHHQLVRSEKLAALGQLVAGVAHELNNPLAGIIGYTELLTEEVKKESSVRRLGKLGNEARRMKRIVDGLLRFARQSHPAARATNFEAALHDAIQLREYHLRKLNVAIQSEVEPLLPDLAIGEDELKQVLLNLLNNAVDAVEESTERVIHISAARHGERVVIQFEDNGPGFADLNRALDPFYTTKPVGKGTGLGLSICYGIVRECGGDIHLSNRQPYGASVTFEIPVAQPVAIPTPA
ncbi:MAG: ATP-binding protein [Candidatus Acidiferrales bacterium]